jgi:flagellar basal body-associated protein FliL
LVHVCPALALFITYNGSNVIIIIIIIIIIIVIATTIVCMTIFTGASQHGVSSYGGVVGQHEPRQHHDTGGV